MHHEYMLWICTAGYALHVMEEYEFNWRDWARNVLHLPVGWTTFYLANAAVIVLGACCSMVGWREPSFSLSYPALMLINAVCFHFAPTVATRIYSPGLATAVVIFLPAGLWTYYIAWVDGALTISSGLLSLLLGAAIMAYPIVLLKIRQKSGATSPDDAP
ncbi:MAG: HXXEE domain-containing protein [Planctomycetaceae bacterium]